MEREKFIYMLEINILRNFSQKQIGCPEVCFLRGWVSKKTPRRPAGYKAMREVLPIPFINRCFKND